MYTYDSLTRIQRKAVDAFIELDPSLKTATTIKRTTLEELYSQASKTQKLGYPAFMTRHKVSRGVYAWPNPSQVKNEPDEFEQSFLQEMKDCGII